MSASLFAKLKAAQHRQRHARHRHLRQRPVVRRLHRRPARTQGWRSMGRQLPRPLHRTPTRPHPRRPRQRRQLTMNIDLLPTLAAMDRPRPSNAELDGKDISAVLTSKAPSPHDELILFNNETVAAIRTARWKLAVRAITAPSKLRWIRETTGRCWST